MRAKTHIKYLFDPLCGWCYGALPALEALAAHPGYAVELAPTGLFAGEGARPMDDAFAAYAWANDQRIARLTRQRFSEDYFQNVLSDRSRLFDSGPATVALVAVALSAPARESEVLKAIQRARYIDGRDITDLSVLSHVLRDLGLSNAAERLATRDDGLHAAYRSRVDAARAEMRHFGIEGVPTLVVGEGERRRLIKTSALFGSVDGLVAGLNAA